MQTIADIMVLVSSGMLFISFGWWMFSEFKYQFEITNIEKINRNNIKHLTKSVDELAQRVNELEHKIHDCATKNKELISQNQKLINIITKTQN